MKFKRWLRKWLMFVVVAFMDQLNSFNDFNHPEVRKRALELQKAVGAMVK